MLSSSVFWRKKRIIDPWFHPDSNWLIDIRTLLYVLSLERLIFLCGNQETKGLYQTINTKHNLHVRRLASLHFCLVPMNLCICIKRSGLWQPNNTTAAHFSVLSTLHFKRIAQLQTKSWEAIGIILFWPFELLRCYLLPKWNMHFWKKEKKKIATEKIKRIGHHHLNIPNHVSQSQ